MAQGEMPNELVIAEAISFSLSLYVRMNALSDLIEELHGPIDAEKLKKLVRDRRLSLADDLAKDGLGESGLWAPIIEGIRNK